MARIFLFGKLGWLASPDKNSWNLPKNYDRKIKNKYIITDLQPDMKRQIQLISRSASIAYLDICQNYTYDIFGSFDNQLNYRRMK